MTQIVYEFGIRNGLENYDDRVSGQQRLIIILYEKLHFQTGIEKRTVFIACFMANCNVDSKF